MKKSNENLILKQTDYTNVLAELTESERKEYVQLSKVLNVNDPNTVVEYGKNIFTIISKNGEEILKNSRNNKTAEVVALTDNLLSELNLIDIDDFTQNKFQRFISKVPIIKHFARSIEKIKIKYDTINTNVEKISNKILSTRVLALKDNTTLETMFVNNINYIGELKKLIIAAKLKQEEIETELGILLNNPEENQIKIRDLQDFGNNVSKKIADLETTEYILYNNLLQIRAIQSNNLNIANKADTIVYHTIPIWKNQLSIAIVIDNQNNSLKAQQKISETTNKMLAKNAENLKQNSINAAKLSEESVISLSTIEKVTNELIETIESVKQIHAEGQEHRNNLEKSLMEYSNAIKEKILVA